MGRVTTTTLPTSKTDNGAFKGFDDTDQKTIRTMVRDGKTVTDIAAVLNCNADEVEQFIANDKGATSTRSRGRRRVAAATEDKPESSAAPPTGSSEAQPQEPPAPKQRKTRRSSKKSKKSGPVVLSEMELAAVGAVMQEAMRLNIEPADLVERMRFEVQSWDKLQGKV